MGPASSITARLMETWAHGQDIADTLGIERPPAAGCGTSRTWASAACRYSYAVNGMPRPDAPIRVELAAPDGGQWAWGPAGRG